MSEPGTIGSVLLFAGGEAGSGAPESVGARSQSHDTVFAELYKQYASMVHGIILARVPYNEVDDIAQDVFLTAYKNLDSLRDRKAVGAWLGTIARNEVAAFYRRTRPAEELSEYVVVNDGRGTEAGEILSAIRSLPATYAETLVLRLVEGMTGPEIAERTGLTQDSVRVNLHRGMKLLKKKLGIAE